MSIERRGRMIFTGKDLRTRRTYSSVTLSTTNPIWIDPGSNPLVLRGERPARERERLVEILYRVSER
jgi:hypothetical protein